MTDAAFRAWLESTPEWAAMVAAFKAALENGASEEELMATMRAYPGRRKEAG